MPVVATSDDLARVVAIIAASFDADPVWGDSAFPDRATRRGFQEALWTLMAGSAMRYPYTFVTPGREAAAVWIPPGGTELTAAEEERFEPELVDLLGQEGADRLFAIFERFAASHPHDEPHWYLSLLGVHPEHAGAGHGMRLLRATLHVVDATGMPAYLESSNRANDRRYAELGFEVVGEVELASGVRFSTMWRPARTGSATSGTSG